MGWTARIREGWEAFDDLGPEWNLLLRSSAADSIFLTREWIDAWRCTAGVDERPFIVEVRGETGRLAGIAPYYRSTARFLGILAFRVLRVLGDSCSGSEYPDWIVSGEDEKGISAAIADALVRDRSFDVIWMSNMAGWTGAPDRVAESCRKAGFLVGRRPISFAWLSLPGSLEDYSATLSPNRLKQLKAQSRKVYGRDGVEFVEFRNDCDVDRFLDDLFRLHSMSRGKEGDPGVFARKPLEADFYRRFASLIGGKGWLRIFGLVEGGEVRAIQHGYVYRNVYHQLQEGFDPGFVPGVGNVLRLRAVGKLIGESIAGYDFLGGMTEHKRRWGAGERCGIDLFLGRPSIKCRLLFTKQVWPTGRFLSLRDKHDSSSHSRRNG